MKSRFDITNLPGAWFETIAQLLLIRAAWFIIKDNTDLKPRQLKDSLARMMQEDFEFGEDLYRHAKSYPERKKKQTASSGFPHRLPFLF